MKGGTAMAACAAVLVAAVGATAHPPRLLTPAGKEIDGSFHRWLHDAKVPLVDGKVELDFGPCPGHPEFVACVYSKRPRRIYFGRRLSDPRNVLYHELGHVFDLVVLNRSERRAFKRILRVRRRGWYRGEQPAAEWFADGYRLCARRRELTSRLQASLHGYRPTPRQHGAVCRLIYKAADDGGPPAQPPRKPPEVIEPVSPPPDLPPVTPWSPYCYWPWYLLGPCP